MAQPLEKPLMMLITINSQKAKILFPNKNMCPLKQGLISHHPKCLGELQLTLWVFQINKSKSMTQSSTNQQVQKLINLL